MQPPKRTPRMVTLRNADGQSFLWAREVFYGSRGLSLKTLVGGAHLAAWKSVFNLSELSGPNLIGNLLFSSIGFVAFIYGKRLSLWKPMFGGLALMVMPYFIADTAMMYGAGALGTGALFFLRE